MTADDTKGLVLQLLKALGDTADKVAERLLALDFKGEPRAACDCPVANYLTANLWDGAYVSIGGFGTVCIDNEIGNNPVIVDLPLAVHEFIARFDKTDIYAFLRTPAVTS